MTSSPGDRQQAGSAVPFVRWVKIHNYKSIDHCHVELGALTVLVGRNGAGKSNFLDALRFIGDSLQSSLDHAIRDRGGIDAIRRQSTGHPRNFAIEIEVVLPSLKVANYGFEIAARSPGGFAVKQEQLTIGQEAEPPCVLFVRAGEHVKSTLSKGPPSAPERLYLVNVAGFPIFDEVYSALTSMGFYKLDPDRMRELQSPDAGELLHRDGGNVASVIGRLKTDQPQALQRITSYLQMIVPGVTEIERVVLGPRETLLFRQNVAGAKRAWKFYATSMSDGTLRALGSLVAVTQLSSRKSPLNLVGIEEPETALHPAAAGALMDALREASAHTQIAVTTHSPDLVDQLDLERDQILVVRAVDGITQIAPPDEGSSAAIEAQLFTPGELLRMNQLEPDPKNLAWQRCRKAWIEKRIKAPKYSETVDQPAMTAAMDLALCRSRSPSFDKLCRELEKRCGAAPHSSPPLRSA